MKKIALSLFVILSFAFYVYHQRTETSDEANVIAPKNAQNNTINMGTPMPMMQGNRQYKDGSYTGDVTDAFYGNLQVKVVITGGKITDIQFLQYPNDRKTSEEINKAAMPILKQETIAAQSDSVDTVSGATQTSDAYKTSLKLILQKAKI